MVANKKIGLGLMLVLLASCSKKEENLPGFRKIDPMTIEVSNSTRIKTTPVTVGLMPVGVDVPGKVSIPEKDLFTFSSRVSGRIDAIDISIGDRVNKGDVFMRIWSPDLTQAAEELKLAKEQNNAELLELTHEKLEALGLKPGDIKENGQTIFNVRSPITGVVLDKRVNSGAPVNPGDLIVTIGKPDSYQFQADVSPEVSLKIKKDMKVIFDDVPGLEATVASVSPVADPVSRLVRVRCNFTKFVANKIPQETFIKAQVLSNSDQALIAPAKALVYNDGKDVVFTKVSEKGNVVVYKKVAINLLGRNKLNIYMGNSSDIKNDTPIVSDGALLLNDMLEEAE